jgi:hypothetical protein
VDVLHLLLRLSKRLFGCQRLTLLRLQLRTDENGGNWVSACQLSIIPSERKFSTPSRHPLSLQRQLKCSHALSHAKRTENIKMHSWPMPMKGSLNSSIVDINH